MLFEQGNEEFLENIQGKITELKKENDLICQTLRDAGYDVFKPGDIQMVDYTVISDKSTAAYMSGNYEGQLLMYNKYLKDVAEKIKERRSPQGLGNTADDTQKLPFINRSAESSNSSLSEMETVMNAIMNL